MIQFYAPDITETPVLPEQESQHCVKVLRKTEGDKVIVVDGKGNRYFCTILSAHHRHTMLEINSIEQVPLTWQQNITIAVAPTKHIDRMEWLVEKLVEIGANRIVPLKCRHSERKEIKIERLEKIAISAMKQSLKATKPEINEIVPFNTFIKTVDTNQKFIAYCDDAVQRQLLSNVCRARKSVTVVIGPEGDFSEDEVRLSLDCGFVPISLGDNRLRTETAALYACSTIHVIDEIK